MTRKQTEEGDMTREAARLTAMRLVACNLPASWIENPPGKITPKAERLVNKITLELIAAYSLGFDAGLRHQKEK